MVSAVSVFALIYATFFMFIGSSTYLIQPGVSGLEIVSQKLRFELFCGKIFSFFFCEHKKGYSTHLRTDFVVMDIAYLLWTQRLYFWGVPYALNVRTDKYTNMSDNYLLVDLRVF